MRNRADGVKLDSEAIMSFVALSEFFIFLIQYFGEIFKQRLINREANNFEYL